jgi:hypothetical protein
LELQRVPLSDSASAVGHVTNPSLLADMNGVVLNRERLLALSSFLKDGTTEFGSSVRGRSMGKALPDGSRIHVRLVPQHDLRVGQVVAYVAEDRMVVHRVVWLATWHQDQYLITRGDATVVCDRPVLALSVVGVVTDRCTTDVWEPVGAPPVRGFFMNRTASAISAILGGLVQLSPHLADWTARRIIRSHKVIMWFCGFVDRRTASWSLD